jgi:hypothetical protein
MRRVELGTTHCQLKNCALLLAALSAIWKMQKLRRSIVPSRTYQAISSCLITGAADEDVCWHVEDDAVGTSTGDPLTIRVFKYLNWCDE